MTWLTSAAASTVGLSFVPLFTEDYYLLIKREALEHKRLIYLIDVLKSSAFRPLVATMPGMACMKPGRLKLPMSLCDGSFVMLAKTLLS